MRDKGIETEPVIPLRVSVVGSDMRAVMTFVASAVPEGEKWFAAVMIMCEHGLALEPFKGPFVFRTPQEAAKDAGRFLARIATRFADEASRKYGKDFMVLVESTTASEEVPWEAGGVNVAN